MSVFRKIVDWMDEPPPACAPHYEWTDDEARIRAAVAQSMLDSFGYGEARDFWRWQAQQAYAYFIDTQRLLLAAHG